MSATDDRSPWSVLMLVTGHGHEILRAVVKEVVSELGFAFHVFDSEGYPVDPSIHSHEACIRAIQAHDIVLVFLDTAEGGTFQVDQATPALIDELKRLEVLPSGALAETPTITQVETLTARAIGKPTLLFFTNEVATRIDQTLASIRQLQLTPKPGIQPPVTAKHLVDHRQWDELSLHYELPTGRIASVRQLLFLERLRKETPNYVTYIDPSDLNDLRTMIRSRLSGVALALVQQHADAVDKQIDRARGPLTSQSLRDLLRTHLIFEPPYSVLSGNVDSANPLYDIEGQSPQALSGPILAGRRILLLGDPGHGKSTAALLCFTELAAAASAGVQGYAPLFASLRSVHVAGDDDSPDAFIRRVISLPAERAPWPSVLELPTRRWLFVLDGADESPHDAPALKRGLEKLAAVYPLLLTCRETVFERQFASTKRLFDIILQLQPWNHAYILRYVEALRAAGKVRAADLIETQHDRLPLADFISIPLWLSMLAYLAERAPSGSTPGVQARSGGQYDLLRTCAAAVAEDELARHAADSSDVERLNQLWSNVAWLLLKSRREALVVRLSTVRGLTSDAPDSPFDRAVLSVLDFVGDEIVGFFHEVFFDFWLAEFIVNRLGQAHAPPDTIAELFSLARSYVTSKLIRQRIDTREDRTHIAASLRNSYDAVTGLGARRVFARNQIIYLLARIDQSEATRRFVREIWNTDEAEFVRYSAAFAAVILGDATVEAEYYDRLKSNDVADRLNRAYHLAYYGDTEPVSEVDVPQDDGRSSADRTLRALFERLKRTELRHRRLRRIELLTVRRFLETRRRLPSEVQDPIRILAGVRAEIEVIATSDFRDGAFAELARITELIASHS